MSVDELDFPVYTEMQLQKKYEEGKSAGYAAGYKQGRGTIRGKIREQNDYAAGFASFLLGGFVIFGIFFLIFWNMLTATPEPPREVETYQSSDGESCLMYATSQQSRVYEYCRE